MEGQAWTQFSDYEGELRTPAAYPGGTGIDPRLRAFRWCPQTQQQSLAEKKNFSSVGIEPRSMTYYTFRVRNGRWLTHASIFKRFIK
jgi:hypothetical protein